jgi:hypothetical protein
VAHNHI